MVVCWSINIAANAGGAWSPIGDVTTIMLWIGGQVSETLIIAVIPSITCMCSCPVNLPFI